MTATSFQLPSSRPNVARPHTKNGLHQLLLAILVIGLSAAWATRAPAQPTSHFSTCTPETGTNATLILPADAFITIEGEPIAVGDEVAVFTPAGHCAGAITWTGANRALTMWGQDAFSEEGQALSPEAPMTFRVWDASTGRTFGGEGAFTVTFSEREEYHTATNRFVPDGIYVVDTLQLTASPHASR